MVKALAHLQRQDDRVDRWSAAWPQRQPASVRTTYTNRGPLWRSLSPRTWAYRSPCLRRALINGQLGTDDTGVCFAGM